MLAVLCVSLVKHPGENLQVNLTLSIGGKWKINFVNAHTQGIRTIYSSFNLNLIPVPQIL